MNDMIESEFREFENFMDMANYYRTKAFVFDTLESAHWYLVYTANKDISNNERDSRLEAAGIIDKSRTQLLRESQDRAIAKHTVRTIKLLDPVNNTYKEKY